ncbi:glycosyltransferase family 2 protein [Algoriphagus halophilus]|uniref:Glycosyltransferase involved in cell wall bisynthesis n=1 Tax=Algoriphagus halophilus TaxID=226505 RepID=A0A1N6ECT4_9BACT|nr:glycosyltransferase family A protein [Algoriphagus halophilus]SIN80826.1 Glycosyltransferase involved in cell wall bisynthesis [Algoriphagus halophilus]
MRPDISIIIPVYNSQGTVERAIKSVVNQSFTNWELILVNDGSTDHSPELCKNWLNNPRICYFSQENHGVSVARNSGAAKATSDWLVFLDADDELEADALALYWDSIKCNPQQKIFVGGITKITGENKVTKIPEEGVYQAKIPGTFCLRTVVFHSVGGFDSRLKFSENTELFHRINLLGYSEILLKKATVKYYDNPQGGSKNSENLMDSLLIILEKHNDTLSSHVQFLYHQILGVNYMRFEEFRKARIHLWDAFQLKPFKMQTMARLMIAFLPPLAKIIYTKN